MKYLRAISFTIIFLFGIGYIGTLQAHAQGGAVFDAFGKKAGLERTVRVPLQVRIAEIIAMLLNFVGMIAIIVILYGGFVYMTSQGEDEKINQSKQIIKNGILGILVVMMSYGIAQFTINSIRFGSGDQCSPGQVAQDSLANFLTLGLYRAPCMERDIPIEYFFNSET